MPPPIEFGLLLAGPTLDLAKLVFIHFALIGFSREIADRRRACLGDETAILRAMDGIAAREQGRAGELGVCDLVIVKSPLLEQLVSRAKQMRS